MRPIPPGLILKVSSGHNSHTSQSAVSLRDCAQLLRRHSSQRTSIHLCSAKVPSSRPSPRPCSCGLTSFNSSNSRSLQGLSSSQSQHPFSNGISFRCRGSFCNTPNHANLRPCIAQHYDLFDRQPGRCTSRRHRRAQQLWSTLYRQLRPDSSAQQNRREPSPLRQ